MKLAELFAPGTLAEVRGRLRALPCHCHGDPACRCWCHDPQPLETTMYDEKEQRRRRSDAQKAGLPLLDPATQAKHAALAKVEAQHEAEIEALAPLARELGLKAGPVGITVSDLREAAGLPTGEGRELSWLVGVMKRAGLVCTDRVRPHKKASTHGRRVAVWIHPSWV